MYAKAISNAVFFFGLALIAYTDTWWPGIMAVIAVSGGLRELLSKRYLSALGAFIVPAFIYFIFSTGTFESETHRKLILPIVFVIIGLSAAFQHLRRKKCCKCSNKE